MKNAIPAQLRWACRRGMLELDLLLGHFLEERYSSLSSEDQAIFNELIKCYDQDLFEWFTGKKQPVDAGLKKMIGIILHHAQHRH